MIICEKCKKDIGKYLYNIKENPNTLMDSFSIICDVHENGLWYPYTRGICHKCMEKIL